ncbi:DUF805 domain-containing protein [Pseudomonas berkeleyensis]|uniref:DUF805 domain-containing protein n=1 Tax=Pseudomonas berkeleyensis TaxID=2726956 RepID=A0A7G5DSK4_9PSED|nr:DUF805 domain-containing protein [Pseudomonas berkeleyensis]QMV64729.1 DUF805 domain-containing protein [Pseudomonas berkeleyensis]WSO40197.1 DUF805 domain-containing protein [Pseudomonas berkeleyensis]
MRERFEPVLESATSVDEEPDYYRVSEAALNYDMPAYSPLPRLFDFSGRLSLSRYWLFHVPFVFVIPTALIVFLVLGLQHQLVVMGIALAVVLLVSCLLFCSLLMRRARDLGWSPIWGVIAALLPVLGTLVLLLLVVLPGRERSNHFGSPNPPMSRLAKVLLGLLVLGAFAASFLLAFYLPQYLPTTLVGELNVFTDAPETAVP